MNSARLAIALLLSVCAWSNGRAEKAPLDLATAAFPSPDGKHVVKFEQKKDGCYFDVNKAKTGRTESSAKVALTPIYSLQWSPDSKDIIIVGQVAHGSAATVFNFSNGAWTSHDTFPSSDTTSDPTISKILYDVAEVKTNKSEIKVVYELTVEKKSDSGQIQDNKCFLTLHLDPDTGKVRWWGHAPLNRSS